MMLYGIGTYSPLETQRQSQTESSASYHKVPPRFRSTLDEVPFTAVPETAPADAHYTVQKGDTLADIVRRHLQAQGKPADNVAVFDAVHEVASANKLHNANRLSVGQVLDLGGLNGATAPKSAPTAAVPSSLPPIAVEVLPPLPQVKPISKGLVESKPLADPAKSQASNEPVSSGGGRNQPIGPLAAFSAQRSVLLSPGPQGGPSHPLGRGLLAELAPEVHYPLSRAGGRPDLGRLLDRLLAPKTSKAESEVLPSPAAAVLPDAGDAPWERAVDGPVRLTSGFGVRKDPFTHRADYHEGLDLAAASGTDIHPVLPGTVTFSGWKTGYGRVVIVDHGDGVESVYGHTSRNLVAAGDRVTEKTVLGHVGASGRATGPHLHLEVRQNGTPIDPIAYLSGPSPSPGNVLAKNE